MFKLFFLMLLLCNYKSVFAFTDCKQISKKIDYNSHTIILDLLIKEINSHIQNGWVPLGTIQTTNLYGNTNLMYTVMCRN